MKKTWCASLIGLNRSYGRSWSIIKKSVAILLKWSFSGYWVSCLGTKPNKHRLSPYSFFILFYANPVLRRESMRNGDNLNSFTSPFLFLTKSGEIWWEKSYRLYILHNIKIVTQDTNEENKISYISHPICLASLLSQTRWWRRRVFSFLFSPMWETTIISFPFSPCMRNSVKEDFSAHHIKMRKKLTWNLNLELKTHCYGRFKMFIIAPTFLLQSKHQTQSKIP